MKKIKPMLATLADQPFDDSNYLFEIKYDGYRAIAKTGKETAFYSRNLLPFQDKYPNIYQELKRIKVEAIFDGEVVAMDEEGHSNFQVLQHYDENPDAPLIYYIFDLLEVNGTSLQDQPLIKRKAELEKLLSSLIKKYSLQTIRYCDHILGKGLKFFDFIQKNDIEGMLAKKIDSTYTPGKRSKAWLKIKRHHRQEAIICGYTAPRGSRKHIGALLLGIYQNKKLKYIGHAAGFDSKEAEQLKNKLSQIKRANAPFKNPPRPNAPVTWVQPKYICEVKFSGLTEEGIMRQPIYLGLRQDKAPQEVQLEQIIKTDELTFSNLDKILWPEKKYTKADLINYYTKIADTILPYLKDRPLTLRRHPHGIHDSDFYQKDVGDTMPKWVKTVEIYSESNDKTYTGVICNNKDSLLYLANLGCIETNPWNATFSRPDNPTYVVFDLDPVEIDFVKCVEVAQQIKDVLDSLKVNAYLKTSGKRGLHIFAPTGEQYTTEQVKGFAELIANIVQSQMPKIVSLERKPEKRQNKVYIDFLQNRKHQTMTAPYSLRATVDATVSTPLPWNKLTKKLDPKAYNIKTIFQHLEKNGDLFQNVLGKGFNLKESLKKLETTSLRPYQSNK